MNIQKTKMPSLLLCIVLDFVGMSTYSLPFIGEFADIIWAPLSGIIFYFVFGSRVGAIGGIFSFIEELFPFTDFIPTFTLAWLVKYFANTTSKKPMVSFGNR
jgi:hypothetical protein